MQIKSVFDIDFLKILRRFYEFSFHLPYGYVLIYIVVYAFVSFLIAFSSNGIIIDYLKLGAVKEDEENDLEINWWEDFEVIFPLILSVSFLIALPVPYFILKIFWGCKSIGGAIFACIVCIVIGAKLIIKSTE